MVVSDWRDKDLLEVVLTDELRVIVISFDDDDLSTDEEIVLMGDIPFSTPDDDSNDDDSLRCYRYLLLVLKKRYRFASMLICPQMLTKSEEYGLIG
ncbi:hypothetical protein Tco_0794753 [Tanacetum coccineum]